MKENSTIFIAWVVNEVSILCHVSTSVFHLEDFSVPVSAKTINSRHCSKLDVSTTGFE